MYFSNISDEEIEKYHQQIYAPNFTIKLTDMADSGLFKIEELTNTILKVYPLFYTKTITSSNPNDQILENKCIICENNNKTRITFISDETAEVEDYVKYGTYKEIGDTLTDAEWNSMVQLIRNNHILTSNIKIKNGSVVDDYGEYVFDINSSTIVDNGILITEETLESLGTVTLTNPAFHNATYTLTLTVLSIDEINILDPSDSETETTTLTLELIENEPVNIPFETLSKYCVILFNAVISIKQDKPIINGAFITDLDITADKPIIQTSETSTLEITATDLEHLPIPNKQIQLLKNNTLLDTLTTDNQGKCSYVYTGVGDGLLNFQAKYQSLTTNTEITDCLFYNNHEEWYNPSSRITVTENTDGSTTLTNNSGTQGFYLANYPNTPKTSTSQLLDWDSPLIIEFTIIQQNNAIIQLYDGTTTTELTELAEGTILIKFLNNKIEYYTNNELIKTDNNTLNTSRIGFRLPNNSTLTYKDFKIYPIGDT